MFGEHRNYLLRTYYVLTTVANPEMSGDYFSVNTLSTFP